MKIHFMSRETHSTDQDKNAQPIREHESGSIGSKQAHAPKKTSLGQAKTHGVRTRRPRTACWTKMGAVGASGRPTDLQVGRPGPWAPPPHPSHVSPPHRSPRSVLGGLATEGCSAARGSLLYIYMRGGVPNKDTPPSWSSHPLQAFSLV